MEVSAIIFHISTVKITVTVSYDIIQHSFESVESEEVDGVV